MNVGVVMLKAHSRGRLIWAVTLSRDLTVGYHVRITSPSWKICLLIRMEEWGSLSQHWPALPVGGEEKAMGDFD